jgi:hypothetical protein
MYPRTLSVTATQRAIIRDAINFYFDTEEDHDADTVAAFNRHKQTLEDDNELVLTEREDVDRLLGLLREYAEAIQWAVHDEDDSHEIIEFYASNMRELKNALVA